MASARGNLGWFFCRLTLWRSDSNSIVSFSEIDTLILMTVAALVGLNAMPLEWVSQIVSESRMQLHSYRYGVQMVPSHLPSPPVFSTTKPLGVDFALPLKRFNDTFGKPRSQRFVPDWVRRTAIELCFSERLLLWTLA
jgi:hypothetical protein